MLTVVGEYTRECMAIEVARRLSSREVFAVLADLCVRYGSPVYTRSDNGPELAARAVRRWLARIDVQTLSIEPGSPRESGYIESFNDRLRDEHLNRERCDTLLEAQVMTEMWRKEYNQVRPHSSLRYRSPAPEVPCSMWKL